MKKWLDWDLEGKPWWKIVLRGAALPGMVVGATTAISLVMSLINTGTLSNYLAGGIGFGLFLSLYGGIEFMITILFHSKDIRTNGLVVLGYAITWAICLYLIFGVFL